MFQTVFSQKKTGIDWTADLTFLSEELPRKHYSLFFLTAKDTFLSGIDGLKSECGALTDFQVALKIQRLIAGMGDSHTMLSFSQMIDKELVFPLHLFRTSDGFHILHTTPENREILGCRLVSVNDFPIQEVVDSLSTIFTVDNQAVVKSVIPQLIPSLQILEFFGFATDRQIRLGLETNAGEVLTYVLKPAVMSRSNRVSFKPDSVAFCIRNENAYFTDLYVADEEIYYMLYNKCWSKEIELEYGDKKAAADMPSFKTFEAKAFDVLKNKPVRKIIFDLRFNGGGNSSQGTAFIESLAGFSDQHPEIKIYVVLGRKTFSSAILNAMDFKRLTNAVFVGEETSGKPNHFGEVRRFRLPSSGLSVSYSTKYFKNTDEDVNTMKPDVVIEMSFSDFIKGIDPVYEWIKKQ